MGIKVLLADDSAAIKKVVQLCLQDFGVEIKSLGNGKEVLELAKNFKPDIALIDVMLPHKPGFDVAMEIKKDSGLQKTPIIMLWSSFMEFDEAKYKSCGAEAKLEKPFEANELRELVKKLVPKAQGQPASSFVNIPKLDFKMTEPAPETSISKTNISAHTPPPSFTISNPEEESGTETTEQTPEAGDSEWVRKDLSKFKVNIDSDGFENDSVEFNYDESQIKDTSFIMKAEVTGVHEAPKEVPITVAPTVAPTPAPTPVAPTPAPAAAAPLAATPAPQIDTAQIKNLLEKQVTDILQKEMRDVLEKAIWKIVPDLATQIIKEEIARLTSEK